MPIKRPFNHSATVTPISDIIVPKFTQFDVTALYFDMGWLCRTLVSDRLTGRLLFQLPETCLIEGAAKKQNTRMGVPDSPLLFAFFCPPLASPLPHNLLGPTKGMTKAIFVRLSSDWRQGVPSGPRLHIPGSNYAFTWDCVRKIYAAV